MKRWTEQDKSNLQKLFLEEKMPIAQIAVTLERTTASVNTALNKFKIPRKRWVKKLHMPERMTPVLARIHAHVCGDGHTIRKREKDQYGYLKPYRKDYYRIRYIIGYTNKNHKLIEEFTNDCLEVFGLTARYDPKRWQLILRSKKVWELMKRLGAGRSREWSIGDEITQGPLDVQAAWIRAFFDDETHFDKYGRIRTRSVNRPGLEQVAGMLRRFVPCHITPKQGLYPDHSCYLVVTSAYKSQFLSEIGSLKYSGATQ